MVKRIAQYCQTKRTINLGEKKDYPKRLLQEGEGEYCNRSANICKRRKIGRGKPGSGSVFLCVKEGYSTRQCGLRLRIHQGLASGREGKSLNFGQFS